jgi:protein tyrosine kinase modulator
MLPGRSSSTSDVLRIMRRWKWLIAPWPIIGVVVSWTIASRMPNRYQSETLILVVPQRVPQEYVKSTVTARIEDRLRTISQEILSRTRLEKIIDELKLYPDLRRQMPLEDVIVKARADVDIVIVRGDSFKLTYTYNEPRIAQQVTERLATWFIEDSMRDRESQAEGTSQFLEAQLEDARRRLIEQEKRLEQYRKAHSGSLPSQMASNLQVIQNTQLQIQQMVDGVNRDRDRRLVVDRMLADTTALLEAGVAPPGNAAVAINQLTPDRQLDAAQQQLKALEERLTAEHPDVQRARRRVTELSAKVAETAPAGQPIRPSTVSAPELARQTELARLRAERESLDRQIAQKIAEEQTLRRKMEQYQARVDEAPTRESELTELTRDYSTLQTAYQQLLAKKEDSRIATNLEHRQIGEQFRILDPARVPERPYSPNRPMINVIGGLAGLVFGVGLVVAIQFSDRTFRTETDIVQSLALPVLALVAAVDSPLDVSRRRRRRRRFVLSAAALVVLAVGAGVIFWTMRS